MTIDINATVTKLMALADEYAHWNRWTGESQTKVARQALEAELTRLFTPLTDEQIITKWMDGRVPVLNFAREIEACHGITGEKNETT